MNTTTTDGNLLRKNALRKLEQARTLVNSARDDMSNLEGIGYCKNYEALYQICEKIGKLGEKIRSLKPPTGVFRL